MHHVSSVLKDWIRVSYPYRNPEEWAYRSRDQPWRTLRVLMFTMQDVMMSTVHGIAAASMVVLR